MIIDSPIMTNIIPFPLEVVRPHINWYIQERRNANINTYAIEKYYPAHEPHTQSLLQAAWKREEKIKRIGRMVLGA
jgi:hypothetical protein